MSITVEIPRSIVEHTYLTKVKPYLVETNECMLFTKVSIHNRYGLLSVVFPDRERIKLGAHRISYLYHNNLPCIDLHVLHTCDTPACCNPKHLFIGTHLENMQDKVAKGKSIVQSGSKNNNVKLTEKSVLDIYTSKLPRDVLAEKYNIARTSIQAIQLKYTWKPLLNAYDELMVG
jgi:hypothetical protein